MVQRKKIRKGFARIIVILLVLIGIAIAGVAIYWYIRLMTKDEKTGWDRFWSFIALIVALAAIMFVYPLLFTVFGVDPEMLGNVNNAGK